METLQITQIRTNRRNRLVAEHVTPQQLATAMQHDTRNDDITTLRMLLRQQKTEQTPNTELTLEGAEALPTYLPAGEFRIDKSGNLVLRHFNGVLTLTVSPIHDRREADKVKQLASALPSTLMACQSCGGEAVKILVAATRHDGTLPHDEDGAEAFCRQAYPLATHVYEGLLTLAATGSMLTVEPAFVGDERRLLHAGFRATLDQQPLLRQSVAPMLVPDGVQFASFDRLEVSTQPADGESKAGDETRQLINFCNEHYAFRQNTVMGYTEYRPIARWNQGWLPVDERVMNGISVDLRVAGINSWDNDLKRFLRSSHVPTYNPVSEYLNSLHDRWDGRDHIGRLAQTVPTDNRHWPQWFRTWLLGMVAQWLGRNPRYGNALVPLLISRQGYNKSTFCRSLIPQELQWGYIDNLVLSEKTAVLRAMSQFLLINLDEFNQISAKQQEGFLKNLIQLASVKTRPPYGSHVVEMPRLASFIATANMSDVLSDPTGNRRFIGIELTGPIDVDRRINHEQLYAQALALLEQDEPYWLDDEQTRLLMASNQQFQQRPPEEMFFHECFETTDDTERGQYMSAAAIFSVVKRHAGSAVKGSNLTRFGRILANMPGLQRRRGHEGTSYLVVPKKP